MLSFEINLIFGVGHEVLSILFTGTLLKYPAGPTWIGYKTYF